VTIRHHVQVELPPEPGRWGCRLGQRAGLGRHPADRWRPASRSPRRSGRPGFGVPSTRPGSCAPGARRTWLGGSGAPEGAVPVLDRGHAGEQQEYEASSWRASRTAVRSLSTASTPGCARRRSRPWRARRPTGVDHDRLPVKEHLDDVVAW